MALMTKAHIEMGIRLDRAGRNLATFLEDELCGAHLGFGKEAEIHLERFRSFLHSYYVGQHSYWPPSSNHSHRDRLTNDVYRSLYFDFRSLYEYLADHSSGLGLQDNRPVDGGICVYQNLMAFDQRSKYDSLPHPLPLLPRSSNASGDEKHGLKKLFANRRGKLDRRIATADALITATNSTQGSVVQNGLVQEYRHFEESWTLREEPTLSCADARKVRWILVYALLQTLVAVTRIPNEVRDTEGVAYPLCVQLQGTPPWPTSIDDHGDQMQRPLPSSLSLKDLILETGPDLDPRASSENRRKRLSLKSPQPIRMASIEFLVSDSTIDSIETKRKGPTSLAPSTSMATTMTDFGSTSASETNASGEGWSSISSDDEMEHLSVQDPFVSKGPDLRQLGVGQTDSSLPQSSQLRPSQYSKIRQTDSNSVRDISPRSRTDQNLAHSESKSASARIGAVLKQAKSATALAQANWVAQQTRSSSDSRP